MLFAGWVLHDVEEAVAFPATCARLADATGIERVRMSAAQSWLAVGLMGVVVGAACLRGARTAGRSRAYRAVVAGLDAHVMTHVAASVVTGGYTAGVVTAPTVMLPAARYAGRSMRMSGAPLRWADTARGVAILMPAALVCHALARLLLSGDRRPRRRRR